MENNEETTIPLKFGNLSGSLQGELGAILYLDWLGNNIDWIQKQESNLWAFSIADPSPDGQLLKKHHFSFWQHPGTKKPVPTDNKLRKSDINFMLSYTNLTLDNTKFQ